MLTYDWTCHACGSANAAEAKKCIKCTCPALASSGQIAEARAKYLNAGGEILPGADLLPDAESGQPLGIQLLLRISMFGGLAILVLGLLTHLPVLFFLFLSLMAALFGWQVHM